MIEIGGNEEREAKLGDEEKLATIDRLFILDFATQFGLTSPWYDARSGSILIGFVHVLRRVLCLQLHVNGYNKQKSARMSVVSVTFQ